VGHNVLRAFPLLSGGFSAFSSPSPARPSSSSSSFVVIVVAAVDTRCGLVMETV